MKQLLFFTALLMGITTLKGQWMPLFNGINLKGWEQVGGEAKYFVHDGAIVGEAVLNAPNSFLTTNENYSDFILEVEVFLSSDMNSGIQIRSNTDKNYRNGVLHGYQVEIDPSSRAFSGGIFDEQRRGWLYPLSRNESARKALKMSQWNHFHIEAIGNTINTWINGVHCARLVDDLTSTGRIGLQVHDIGNNSELVGARVKWKNMKIATNKLEALKYQVNPDVIELSYLVNELSDWEQRNGFRLLWDGKTSNGWRGRETEGFPETGWSYDNGELSVVASGGKQSLEAGDIVTMDDFFNFELSLEFKIVEAGNSGIKYFVDPDLNLGGGSGIGCEFQILDDLRHPDANMGVNGNRTVGSLYDLISAENLSIPGRDKQFKGVDNWNHARIVSKNGKVEHWLNHEKVVEYDRFSQMFTALVAYSKYANWENFARWQKGKILLQEHGQDVSFRSIKIREFN